MTGITEEQASAVVKCDCGHEELYASPIVAEALTEDHRGECRHSPTLRWLE